MKGKLSRIPFKRLIKSNTNLTSRIDSWVFGIILFNILFGHSPVGYYSQLKKWFELIHNQKFNKEIYDLLFLNNKYPVYFNLHMICLEYSVLQGV